MIPQSPLRALQNINRAAQREKQKCHEGLDSQANTVLRILCSFSMPNHESFLSRGGHDLLRFLINKRSMHVYYILSQAKQIVWDDYHYGSSFGTQSSSAEVAGTWRGQEICDLVSGSTTNSIPVNDPSKYWVPLLLL